MSLSNHEKTWRKLKRKLLCERGQCGKTVFCMIPIIWHSRKGRTVETEKDQWLPGVGGGELKRKSTEDF